MRRLLFIYIRLWRERNGESAKEKVRERERERERRGRRQAEFYLWPIRLINNARLCRLCLSSTLYHREPLSFSHSFSLSLARSGQDLACMANGVEKLIRSLTNRIRNSATRARLGPSGAGWERMSAVPQVFRGISINQTKGASTSQSVLTKFNELPVIARRDKCAS